MQEYTVEVYGRKVFRAEVPDEITSRLVDLGWKINERDGGMFLIAPDDVHNWLKGEVLIREASKLILPDLTVPMEDGEVLEIYIEDLKGRKESSHSNKVINFNEYRLMKNALQMMDLVHNLEQLLQEKVQLVMQEEELLENMRKYGYPREKIEAYESKLLEHKKNLERDFDNLAKRYPKIREQANLITLKSLLSFLDELQETDIQEYMEVKKALREAVIEHFSPEKAS